MIRTQTLTVHLYDHSAKNWKDLPDIELPQQSKAILVRIAEDDTFSYSKEGQASAAIMNRD